jgi:hypothetical protein
MVSSEPSADAKLDKSRARRALLSHIPAFLNLISTLLLTVATIFLVVFAARQEKATYVSNLSAKQLELVADYLKKVNLAQKYVSDLDSFENDRSLESSSKLRDYSKVLNEAEESGRVLALITPSEISDIVGNSIYALEVERRIILYASSQEGQARLKEVSTGLKETLNLASGLLTDVQKFTYSCAARTFKLHGVLLDEFVKGVPCKFEPVKKVPIGAFRDIIPGVELRPADPPEYFAVIEK